MEKEKRQEEDRQEIPPKVYPPTRYSDTLYGCGYCKQELEEGKPNFCRRCGRAIKWD